jgi:hypothetical protein
MMVDAQDCLMWSMHMKVLMECVVLYGIVPYKKTTTKRVLRAVCMPVVLGPCGLWSFVGRLLGCCCMSNVVDGNILTSKTDKIISDFKDETYEVHIAGPMPAIDRASNSDLHAMDTVLAELDHHLTVRCYEPWHYHLAEVMYKSFVDYDGSPVPKQLRLAVKRARLAIATRRRLGNVLRARTTV